MRDTCDHNFGTFDDFGVKNDQKVSNNMILMSKYKGKHGGKKGQQIRAMPERKHFFFRRASLSLYFDPPFKETDKRGHKMFLCPRYSVGGPHWSEPGPAQLEKHPP